MAGALLASALFVGVAGLLTIALGRARVDRRYGDLPRRPTRPAVNPPEVRLVFRKAA